MIFEADAEQISRLDGATLVRLMKRLLLAESRLFGIPLRSTMVPLQITVPDGGEDGRIAWIAGVDSTDFIPSRFSIFQSKARNLTEGSVRAEVFAKDSAKAGKVKPELNNAISEALSRGGAYVIFCSHAFTGQKIRNLQRTIADAIAEAGANASLLAAIEVYDANKIAEWANTHPSVALWLTSLERRRSSSGFQSHEGWGRSAEIAGVPWVSDDSPRFVPANRRIPDDERKDRRRNAWTFVQAAEAALRHLSENQGILRVAGPSGFGKSRFAYEVFNRRDVIADEVDGASVIYADQSIVGDDVAKLALEIADSSWPATLVVDDCPDALHSTLAGIAQRTGSRLQLVTIDVETRMQQAKDTLVINLEPASDELIVNIAKAVAPTLSDEDSRFIQNLSSGFPRMAVLSTRLGGRRQQSMLSVDQVLHRIIWGTRTPNNEAEKALEFLSIFDWLGVAGRVKDQSSYVARELVGISEDSFVEHVNSFIPRGIVVRRGDFVQVQPTPLAVRLAIRRLSLLPGGRLTSFFTRAPEELDMSLLRRFRWLDTSPTAQVFARDILHATRLGNVAALNTRFGAECIDRLVHVEPDAVMATLDRLVGVVTRDGFQTIKGGHSGIVRALEKLAFRRKTFGRAARLLLRLGAAETEENIENSGRERFRALYQLYLCGTEASPDERLRVLDEGLKSPVGEERELCIEALGRMLQTGHFTRGSGAEEIGSGERLEDWAPTTDGEICDFHRAAIGRLTDIAVGGDQFAGRARALLGSHIRDLLNFVPFSDVKAMIERIVAHSGLWPEAIQGVNSWLYYDRHKARTDIAGQIRTFFDQLMPTDPVKLVLLYTDGWRPDFHDPDTHYPVADYDYPAREVNRLAEVIVRDAPTLENALERLVTSDARTVFPFARRLAELANDPAELFVKALTIAEARDGPANNQFFVGLVAGADQRDPEKARLCVRSALQSPKLKEGAVLMIASAKLRSDDLDLVASLLRSGDVEPGQCATLSYDRGLCHLSFEQIMPLLHELELHGPKGTWAIIDIVSMHQFDLAPLPTSIVQVLKRCVILPDLFNDFSDRTMDGWRLEQMVGLVLKHESVDSDFASSLMKRLLDICRLGQSETFSVLEAPILSAIAPLLVSHPNEVWREASEVLMAADPSVQSFARRLLGENRDDNLAPALLYGLPSKLYLDWVREAPASRAAVAVEWLPVAAIGDNGKLAWHPDLEAFVREFGDQPQVLAGIANRLPPRRWRGPIVPYLESLLPLLQTWGESHPRPEVRGWSDEYFWQLNDAIAGHAAREEDDWGGVP